MKIMKIYILICFLIIFLILYNIKKTQINIEYFTKDVCIINEKKYYIDIIKNTEKINNYKLLDSCKNNILQTKNIHNNEQDEIDDINIYLKYLNKDNKNEYKMENIDNKYILKTNKKKQKNIILYFDLIKQKIYIKQNKQTLYYLKLLDNNNAIIKEKQNDIIFSSIKNIKNKISGDIETIFKIRKNNIDMLEIFLLSYILIIEINKNLLKSYDI
jgi:hypothetical protein